MLGSLHDLTCERPVNCTCSSIAIRKPTPRAKVPKPLKSRPRGVPTSISQAVFTRDSWLCQWCEQPGGGLDPHHVLPRSRGGKDSYDNLISVHRKCHRYIHDNPSAAKAREFIA